MHAAYPRFAGTGVGWGRYGYHWDDAANNDFPGYADEDPYC